MLNEGEPSKCGGGKLVFNGIASLDIYGNVPVTQHAARADEREPARSAPEPGTRMEDGTIYAGLSPQTGTPLYVGPADAPLDLQWKAAMDYAANLDANGHKDWRLPTRQELNVLFDNRASIQNLDATVGTAEDGNSYPGLYWTSVKGVISFAWFQRFSDGVQSSFYNTTPVAVRCVRG